MLAQTDPPKKSALKNPLLYSWTTLSIVALVVVWILFSRWLENRNIETRSKQEHTQKQLEQDRIASSNSAKRSWPSKISTPLLERFAAAKPLSCATAWPTPRPSSSNLSPIPSGPPTPVAST